MDKLAFAWVKPHIPGSLPMLKRLQVGLKYLTILPLSLYHCTADFYAEDSTLHISDKNKTQIETKLQSDSDQVTIIKCL